MGRKALVLGFVLFLGVLIGHQLRQVPQVPPPAPALSETSQPSVPASSANFSKAISSVAAKVMPAVVNLDVRSIQEVPVFDFGFFGDEGPTQQEEVHGMGTGFIVTKDGYVVTNAHVVRNATAIRATLADGRIVKGKLRGIDGIGDLAVVKLEDGNYPTLPFGSSDGLEVGDWVVAVGNPFGYQHTVTAGIVSALHRTLEDPREKGSLIQTDAAINPGNSGGPLVNLKGEIVGINQAIESPVRASVGLGFAIPINEAKPIVQSLIEKGKYTRPYLGVNPYPVNDRAVRVLHLPFQKGVVVLEVVRNSPAHRAGLQQYDVITKIDDTDITSPRQLIKTIQNHKVGDGINIRIFRKGQYKTVTAVLQALPE